MRLLLFHLIDEAEIPTKGFGDVLVFDFVRLVQSFVHIAEVSVGLGQFFGTLFKPLVKFGKPCVAAA